MCRVCFISISAYGYFNEDAPAGGGAQRQFYFLSTSLADSFDVHFVVGDYGQPKVEHREDVTLHRAYTPDRSTPILQRGKQLVKLWNALSRADADVYIARCPPQKLNKLFLLIGLLDRPMVYHIATDAFVRPLPEGTSRVRRKIYSEALQKCEIVVQTQKQANQIQTNWNASASVIPNGYPESSVIDTYESREYFLWVGRLDKIEKRPHLFLDLAEELPNEKFIMIGSPEECGQYTEQVVQRASNTPNITYTGHVSPSEIHDYYRRAIAVVNTSAENQEGFPNTFLEAWRYGTPVLALDIDLKRFHNSSEGMNSYARGEFDTLVLLAEKVASSMIDRKTMGVSSLKSYVQQYRLETVVDSYEKVLKSIIT